MQMHPLVVCKRDPIQALQVQLCLIGALSRACLLPMRHVYAHNTHTHAKAHMLH